MIFFYLCMRNLIFMALENKLWLIYSPTLKGAVLRIRVLAKFGSRTALYLENLKKNHNPDPDPGLYGLQKTSNTKNILTKKRRLSKFSKIFLQQYLKYQLSFEVQSPGSGQKPDPQQWKKVIKTSLCQSRHFYTGLRVKIRKRKRVKNERQK